jgi:hypothetical protein
MDNTVEAVFRASQVHMDALECLSRAIPKVEKFSLQYEHCCDCAFVGDSLTTPRLPLVTHAHIRSQNTGYPFDLEMKLFHRFLPNVSSLSLRGSGSQVVPIRFPELTSLSVDLPDPRIIFNHAPKLKELRITGLHSSFPELEHDEVDAGLPELHSLFVSFQVGPYFHSSLQTQPCPVFITVHIYRSE